MHVGFEVAMAREFDAFLSYNNADGYAANTLYRLLTDTFGLKVWLDKNEVLPGASVRAGRLSAVQRPSRPARC